jgi:hypothetical protein
MSKEPGSMRKAGLGVVNQEDHFPLYFRSWPWTVSGAAAPFYPNRAPTSAPTHTSNVHAGTGTGVRN